QNAIADVAAARRPAVIIAQPRPHAEQSSTAAALRAGGLAVVLAEVPAPPAWSRVLDAAVSLGGSQWKRWSSGSGAARAAEVLQGLACAPRGSRSSQAGTSTLRASAPLWTPPSITSWSRWDTVRS